MKTEPMINRRADFGQLAECPMCGSLDIGGAHDTVNCYRCGLQITKPAPLQNAIDAWNTRSGKALIQKEREDSDKLREIIEIYANMEGFEPQYASEAYLLKIIEDMYQVAIESTKVCE